MAKYDIWVEGFSATGEHAPASYLGSAEAETFEEACKKFFTKKATLFTKGGYDELYDPVKNTHWQCKLFDNKADAAKSFG